MASSTIDTSASEQIQQQIQQQRQGDSQSAMSELSRLATAAQDPMQDHGSIAAQVAVTVTAAMYNINSTLSNVQSQVQSGGNSSQLRNTFDTANSQMSQLQSAIGTVNNALYSAGSPVRLKSTGTGVQVQNVGTQQAPSSTYGTNSSVPSSQWTDGLTSDPDGPSTSNLSGLTSGSNTTGADSSLKNSPLWQVMVEVVKDVVQALVAQQNGGGMTSPSTGSSSTPSSTSAGSTGSTSSPSAGSSSMPSSTSAGSSTPSTTNAPSSSSNYAAPSSSSGGGGGGGGGAPAVGHSPNASTAGETGSSSAGEGLNAQAGEGSNLMNMVLKALQKSLAQKTGTTTGGKGGKGGKNASASMGHTGATNQSFGSSPSTGSSSNTSSSTGSTGGPGLESIQGQDNLPISVGSPSAGFNADPGADPLIGAANINGLLMMVLLECYQDGQKDLQSLAERLQDINNAKAGLRNQLDSLRTSQGSNSTQVQNLEDQLNSMGDDAQMEQLDLQNMSQNQQQLLQMISDFSKNTNTNSMAIIRNIGGY